MIPGETACFACAVPIAVIEDNEAKIKREGNNDLPIGRCLCCFITYHNGNNSRILSSEYAEVSS